MKIKSVFRLLFKHWLRIVFPIVYVLVISPFFIWIFMLINDQLSKWFTFSEALMLRSGFASAMIISLLPVAFSIMVPEIIQLRNSILTEQLGVANIKKSEFIFSILFYYFLIMLFTVCWNFLWILIIYNKDAGLIFEKSSDSYYTNWGGFILSILLLITMILAMGACIGMLCKDNIISQIISSMFYVLCIIFSGQIIPTCITDENIVLNVISHLSPFRYTGNLLRLSWNELPIIYLYSPEGIITGEVMNGGIFNPWLDYKVLIEQDKSYVLQVMVPSYDIWLSWFIPPVITAGMVGLTVGCFKWKE